MKNYLEEIRVAVRARHTRQELRRIYLHGTGKIVPAAVNLRNHVSHWHRDQQAINNGAKPSGFWMGCNFPV